MMTSNNFFPNTIGADLKELIFSNIGGEQAYWKSLFSKTVIVQIDPKSYFSHHVLSEIDAGWQTVGIIKDPCSSCKDNGYKILNPFCNNCYQWTICMNCYWYNKDPYNNGNFCFCSLDQVWVSWKDMRPMFQQKIQKYTRYWDFLRGQEWSEFLQREADIAAEIDRGYQIALNEQEQARIEFQLRVRERYQLQQELFNNLTNSIEYYINILRGEVTLDEREAVARTIAQLGQQASETVEAMRALIRLLA